MNKKVSLVLIITLGFILRAAYINVSPPALYGDELTIALDANSLLRTGKDQLGNSFPLTFPMGAGRPAGYVYGSIPFVAIFGTTELGVRSLSILSGLGIIILLYLLGRKFLSDKVGLAAAFIDSVSPWGISLSRGGFEANFALFLALLGIYFLISLKKPAFYIFAAICLGLTLHTYPTYKLSFLLFLPNLFWFQGIKRHLSLSKYFISGVIIFLVLGIFAFSQTILGGSEKRFTDINIFSRMDLRDKIEQKINNERTVSNLPNSIASFFHNKPTEYTKVLLENYFQNFSIDFLILHGDRNPRHNMATMGEMFLVEIILLAIGILSLWDKNKRLLTFLLIWLLIAPIPTAVVDLPHALRSSFMLPPLIILSAFGFSFVLGLKNKLLILLLSTIFLIQFVFFTQKLFFLSPELYGMFWSKFAKATSYEALHASNKYDYILLSDSIDAIEFAYPVYSRIDPNDVINQSRNKDKLGNYYFKRFGNVYIGHIPDGEAQSFLENLGGSYLYIDVNRRLERIPF